jgi:hypothetical protein
LVVAARFRQKSKNPTAGLGSGVGSVKLASTPDGRAAQQQRLGKQQSDIHG